MTDPHGSVVQLTDENGKVTKIYEYDSFGNEVKPDKKDENPFRYCGEYYDKETEEVYLRARYYQPKMGRFLTRDTYTGEEDEPESLHLYTYCYNNPIMYADMAGNKPKITVSKPVPTLKPKPAPKVPGPTPRPGPKPTKQSKATQIIRKYRKQIKKYGEKYEVDPVIVGGCIYAEQKRNVN